MSASKGASFERKIANKLSKAFAKFYPDENGKIVESPFTRVLHSGAYYGKSNSHRAKSRLNRVIDFGDIATPESFPYTIECKHYKTAFSLKALMSQSIPQLDKWLKQTTEDANNANKSPMLIIKYNLVDEIVFFKGVTNLTPIFIYKGWRAYRFSDILNDKFYYITLRETT